MSKILTIWKDTVTSTVNKEDCWRFEIKTKRTIDEVPRLLSFDAYPTKNQAVLEAIKALIEAMEREE